MVSFDLKLCDVQERRFALSVAYSNGSEKIVETFMKF